MTKGAFPRCRANTKEGGQPHGVGGMSGGLNGDKPTILQKRANEGEGEHCKINGSSTQTSCTLKGAVCGDAHWKRTFEYQEKSEVRAPPQQ